MRVLVLAQAKSKEPESAQEVLRSIVRALLVFNQIPGVELCAQYAHFFKQVQATSVMQALIREAVSGHTSKHAAARPD